MTEADTEKYYAWAIPTDFRKEADLIDFEGDRE